MRTTLFSFGTWQYYLTLDKLGESALGKVDRILLYKESDIETGFYVRHRAHFRDQRGFGYWIWKPYFINRLLARAEDEDVFAYVDAGNLVRNGLHTLFELCHSDRRGLLLFDNRESTPKGGVWKNARWTKSDCFNLMNLNSPEYVQGNQVNASYIVFRRTDFTVGFFDLFMKACQNYNIISDAPNVTEDFNTRFKDHRHDQSVLSLLSIRYRVSIYKDPSQWGYRTHQDTDPFGQVFDHHRRRFLIR
jgi:hypothetical protein